MPGIKRKATKELSVSKLTRTSTSTSSSSASTPTLRRAPTVELKPSDSSPDTSLRKSTSKRSSILKSATPSLTKTASLIEGDIITAVSSLKSGSSIGKTTSITSSEGKRALSKSTSLTRSGSLLGKRISESSDHPELTSAKVSKTNISKETTLEKSLTTSLSKTGSIAVLKRKSTSKTSLVKSSSKTSVKSSKDESELADIIGELRKSVSGATGDMAASTAPFLPPGGLMEIVFSFDTTGSMYSYLEQVRGGIQDMVQRLQADIPGIRIAIIAHGDYCDANNYIIQWIDFGSTVTETCDFVKNIGRTGGGDSDECYELVLRRAHEVLSWTPGSQRSLVIIGDAHPHEKGYNYDKHKVEFDWRDEVYKLRDMGVRIYSVQAGHPHPRTSAFYENIAKATDGKHIRLDELSSIFDMMMSICYREGGADLFMAYEAEIRARKGAKGLTTGFENNLDELRDSPATFPKAAFIIPPAGSLPAGSLFTPLFGSTSRAPASTSLFGSTTLFGKKHATKKIKTKPVGAAKTKKVLKLTKKAKTTVPKKKKTTPKTKPQGKRKVTKKSKDQKRKPKAKKTSTSNKRKPKKATKPSQKKTKRVPKTKNKKKINNRQKREIETDAKLDGVLGKVVWSPWKLAIAAEKPSKHARGWIPYKSAPTPGVRFKKLWDEKRNPFVYEFAVQAPGKKKMNVVYIRPTIGFSNQKSWDGYLLRHKSVKTQIGNIIKQQGKIFSRRCAGSSSAVSAAGEYLLKHYCYAWRVNCNGKTHRRSLKVKGFVISQR